MPVNRNAARFDLVDGSAAHIIFRSPLQPIQVKASANDEAGPIRGDDFEKWDGEEVNEGRMINDLAIISLAIIIFTICTVAVNIFWSLRFCMVRTIMGVGFCNVG
jgi:hypothetical protein